jgi:hypothetical protein
MVNMTAGDAECYITHLPGSAGGTLANVNRWRDQLGLAEIGGDELAKLPNRKVLGRTAVYVALTDDALTDDAGKGILGVILPYSLGGSAGTLFVKMVGPWKTLSETEGQHFDAFCASLAPASDHGGGDHSGHNHAKQPDAPSDHDHDHEGDHDHDHEGEGETSGPPPPGPDLSWTTPEGWTQEAKPRSMREVTFQAGTEVECYVSILRGAAGGVEANANRWRNQVGLAPLDAAAIAALKTVAVLGREAQILDATGTYTDMEGQKHENSTLLGVVCELEDSTLFVKMLGPSAAVSAERERFLALCASLKDASK